MRFHISHTGRRSKELAQVSLFSIFPMGMVPCDAIVDNKFPYTGMGGLIGFIFFLGWIIDTWAAID
jgi:hypothetical protein